MKKLSRFLGPAGAFVLTAAFFALSIGRPASAPSLPRCLLGSSFVLFILLLALLRRRKKPR